MERFPLHGPGTEAGPLRRRRGRLTRRSAPRFSAARGALLTLVILAVSAAFAANASAVSLQPVRGNSITQLDLPRYAATDRAHAKSAAFVVRHALARPGFYAVRVTVKSRVAGEAIRLSVSRELLSVVTGRKHHRAIVTTRVWSHGSALIVRATARNYRGLHVRIKVHRLASPVLLVREHVTSPGLYAVRVIVSARSKTVNLVSLQIGAAKPSIVAARRHQPATVTANEMLAGQILTVRASGRRARPRVTVMLSRLNTPAPVAPAAAAPVAASQTGPGLTAVVPSLPGTWNLAFDDEFNGTSLDTSKWSTGWFGSGITGGVSSSEPECYDPRNVVEANGELDLNFTSGAESCDGSTHPYVSGIVTTDGKFNFTYGLIEIRAWLPTTSSGQVANWPDLWTDGQNWPADGEIDIVEGLEGQACAHWHGPTDGGAGYGSNGGTGCPSGTFTGGWHTFAADWEPGIVTWYYDGQDIGCIESSGSACGSVNSTITSSPMYLILSLGASPSNPITDPTSARIDYVRVWQH